jgi:hypothetical protein
MCNEMENGLMTDKCGFVNALYMTNKAMPCSCPIKTQETRIIKCLELGMLTFAVRLQIVIYG